MTRQGARAALGWLAVVVASFAITACSGATRWWMFQGDLRHSGRNSGLNGAQPHTLLWNVPLVTGTVQFTPPVFGKNKILIGTGIGDGKLYALSPSNGSIVWSFSAPAGNGFSGAAAAVGNRVYAATSGPSAQAYALNESTGAIVWQTPLAGASSAAIAVAAGHVFVSSDQNRVYALNAASGGVVWSTPTSPGAGTQASAPAVEFGRVYAGSNDGLFAFNALTGAQMWKFPLASAPSWSSAVVYVSPAGARLVYINTVGGGGASPMVHAVNAMTGAQVWSYTGPGMFGAHTSALADGKLFIFEYLTLKALDAATGAPLWSYTPAPAPAAALVGAMAVGDRLVYFADSQTIRGVNIGTGTLVWNAPIPGNGNPNAPGNSPGIEFELLVVPNKGHVYAFR